MNSFVKEDLETGDQYRRQIQRILEQIGVDERPK